jgi:hypothetical protein
MLGLFEIKKCLPLLGHEFSLLRQKKKLSGVHALSSLFLYKEVWKTIQAFDRGFVPRS